MLNDQEQGRLGKYIRACEVDRLQSTHYEEAYQQCTKDLGEQPSLATKVVNALLFLSVGYAIGVSK